MAPLKRTFRSTTRIKLADPGRGLDILCQHYQEHARKAAWSDEAGLIELSFGTANLANRDGSLHIEALASDLASLAYLRVSMAHHMELLDEAEPPALTWEGDGCDVGPLPYFRALRVAAAQTLSPHMRRLTLNGPDIERFATGGLHVRLVIPPAGVADPIWPTMGSKGLPSFPQGPDRPETRTYTIRRIDVATGLIDVDFVVHAGDSVGSDFALRAKPGDPVGMMGPGGGDLAAADWYLMAGDETALPAIARMLEELSPEAQGTVIIEVNDPADELPLKYPEGVQVRWLHRGRGTSLEEAVRAVSLPGDRRFFIWAAAEFDTFKAIRRYCRDELNLTKEQHLVGAFWRRGLKEGEKGN
ncbi:NADPH-dependent ferric siderophore reductase, contains FAD-binding and SIP domains [Arboricoccus pini]|uniref:NADPH-dependent ferric siderophore reductase, contains FAD-binding and SIP domains n=1 Tax=Arboricoccus pini TaxID=1963835 RepID=A0A212QXM2_9PROT|nr:siderophore-interacting protein [Arboricoccus pini]SNB64306.1 NADPH-dependent ferric siderophore reductase, contains FAD-binding and SIP domains [Arboricoccus pini]